MEAKNGAGTKTRFATFALAIFGVRGRSGEITFRFSVFCIFWCFCFLTSLTVQRAHFFFCSGSFVFPPFLWLWVFSLPPSTTLQPDQPHPILSQGQHLKRRNNPSPSTFKPNLLETRFLSETVCKKPFSETLAEQKTRDKEPKLTNPNTQTSNLTDKQQLHTTNTSSSHGHRPRDT